MAFLHHALSQVDFTNVSCHNSSPKWLIMCRVITLNTTVLTYLPVKCGDALTAFDLFTLTTITARHWIVVCSSSSSSNDYHLGGIIALLLQDHCTMSTKSVCSSQYMVTDQHWGMGAHIKHSTLSDRVREWQPEQNGLQFSTEDGKRSRVANVLRCRIKSQHDLLVFSLSLLMSVGNVVSVASCI